MSETVRFVSYFFHLLVKGLAYIRTRVITEAFSTHLSSKRIEKTRSYGPLYYVFINRSQRLSNLLIDYI